MNNEPVIACRNLKKTFGKNFVLRGVNLNVHKGETLVILGPSGSGKSVLIKHFIGVLKPDSGQVLVEGRDVVPLSEDELLPIRLKISMVFQGGALFDSMNVFENVAYSLFEHTDLSESAIRERVREKLDLVGLSDIEHKMPSSLSGGMKKRVALARAIASDPEVILYDEPTTGLDPITANKFNDLVLSTQKALQVTSVIVTHDLVSAFKVADRLALIHEGRILMAGTPDEFRQSSDPVVKEFITGGESEGGYASIIHQ